MSHSPRRDAVRALGAAVLLLALPAWASDMCPIGSVFLLPPAFLVAFAGLLAGLWVRGRTAAVVWGALLGVLALPGFGAALLNLSGAYHGPELAHPNMLTASAVTLAVLLASYVWAFQRLLSVSRRHPRPLSPASRA